MIQSLLKAANKQQQGQHGPNRSMNPGYTSGTTRNRRTPARSSSWKDCFRREKVAGMIFICFLGQVQNRRSLPKTGRSGRSFRIYLSPVTQMSARFGLRPSTFDLTHFSKSTLGFPKIFNVKVI